MQNESLTELRREFETALSALKAKQQEERQTLQDIYWKRALSRLPPGVNQEAWFGTEPPPAKRRRPNIVRHSLPGNQFTTPGGRSACTTIAFVALCRMSTKSSADAIHKDIKWGDVLKRGAGLWHTIMGDRQNLDGQRYLSLFDLRQLPQLRKLPSLLQVLEKATELTGSLDPAVNAFINDSENKSMYNLSEALETIHKMEPSVAVVTVGGFSVCVWNRDSEWALYDSHGGVKPGSSLLVVVKHGTARDMEAILRRRFGNKHHYEPLHQPIDGKRQTTYYYASVLSAEAVSACRNG